LVAVFSLLFVLATGAMAQDTSLYHNKKTPQALPLNDTVPYRTDTLKYKPWKQDKMEKYKQPKSWPDTPKRIDTLKKENQ
jgi:hypothetical protein